MSIFQYLICFEPIYIKGKCPVVDSRQDGAAGLDNQQTQINRDLSLDRHHDSLPDGVLQPGGK